jgi:hypothetical protein
MTLFKKVVMRIVLCNKIMIVLATREICRSKQGDQIGLILTIRFEAILFENHI